ncbi:DUF2357 domain-containing protein [Candidatus Chloroploca sp. M-50]|uniref:DUF2357 domain-containing protein n=1 Tax=Candidatus Chloroploca mongolica TaxID=2528176 RepID=A0ABS4D5M5_9CHLR|nr:DUF2357 domain-containing protein [Candidatus Chloroploca mongolica]MBP1464731.1 DUF2357 domain-containing protein [Candidatus Chloroploca mongolica]
MPIDLLLDEQMYREPYSVVEGASVELHAVPPAGASSLTLTLGGVSLEPFLRPGDPAWRWRWLAPASTGEHEVLVCARWPDGRTEEVRAQIVVVPRKLDAEHYALLLEDLQTVAPRLVFALTGGRHGVKPDPTSPSANATAMLNALCRDEIPRLVAAVERLAQRPPERLQTRTIAVDPGTARRPALHRGELINLSPAPSPESEHLSPASLSSIPEEATEASYDSYETRLLRRLIEVLLHRLGQLASLINPTPALESARQRLRELRSLPLLAEVPPLQAYRGLTSRMQRDPDYRIVARVWQWLRRHPLITWDAATLTLPISQLPRLYERWCAVRVALTLLELPGHTLISQALWNDDAAEQGLTLTEGTALVVLANEDGNILTLRYHPRYPPDGTNVRSLDRHTRIPDLALESTPPEGLPRISLLDAKYRLDPSGGVPADALADGYSYLGAIGNSAGQRLVERVALLYPGRGKAEHYASGIAALPLLPGHEAALRAWLVHEE